MSNKKRDRPDGTNGTQPSKRSKSGSGFRLCQPPTSELPSRSVSRVTTLKKIKKGRTGQRSEDRVHQLQAESEPLADPMPPISESELQIDTTAFDTTSDSPPCCPSVNTPSKPRRERNNKNVVSSFLLSLYMFLISTQTKLTEWIGYRDSCLDELLRHDAHGDFLGQSACSRCGEGEGVFKCKDCLTGCQLRCQGCVISTHQDHPLHRIEVSPQIIFFPKLLIV